MIKKIVSPQGKTAFLNGLKKDCVLLDVGCGNDSPKKIKKIIPKCLYYGIDVDDYNQSSSEFADEYIITNSKSFVNSIKRYDNFFDAIISSHNLEHCEDWKGTLRAMYSALKKDGKMYISFPSHKTKNFPSRVGTLNFFDDTTHKNLIYSSEFYQELKFLKSEILFSTESYQPSILFFLGFLLEPISNFKKKVLPGTWAYYGFEQIFIIKKN